MLTKGEAIERIYWSRPIIDEKVLEGYILAVQSIFGVILNHLKGVIKMHKTKDEISMAKDTCNAWLKYYNNNSNEAYVAFIKYTLECEFNFPYYMKGLSDFIMASKENVNNLKFVCIQRKFDLN